MLEVNVPGEVGRARADRYLDRRLRVLRGHLVEVREPDRPARDRAAVDHAAPVIHDLGALRPGRHADRARVLLAGGLEAADPLVHVPAERPNDADVVVVPHVAVGHDIEPRVFLIADDRGDGVVVRLFVLHFLEGDADVTAEQLMPEPVGPRVGTDHRGGEQGVDDSCIHERVLPEKSANVNVR